MVQYVKVLAARLPTSVWIPRKHVKARHHGTSMCNPSHLDKETEGRDRRISEAQELASLVNAAVKRPYLKRTGLAPEGCPLTSMWCHCTHTKASMKTLKQDVRKYNAPLIPVIRCHF